MLRTAARVAAATAGAAIGGLLLNYHLATPLVDPSEAKRRQLGLDGPPTPARMPADMRTLPPIRFLNACGDTFHRITRRPLFHVKSRKVKQQLKELREVVPEEVADEIETSIDLLDEAYSEEKGFSPAQRLLTSIFLSNLGLKPRVALEKAYLEHQEVLQEATLPRTLLVTGMARTGSTLLHNLLGQDPSCRYLTGWEQQHPLPFPTADTYHSDPRIEKAREGFKGMDKLVSNATRYYRMYHDHDGAALEEEYYLLLHSVLFPSIILPRTGSHFDFFLKEDKFAAYQHLKNFLLLNCHYHPPKSHLVLKTPLHGFHMKELLATFNKDEAVLVVTHRNPKNTVPSLCRLMLFTMVIGMRDVGKDPMYCVEEVGKRTAEWQHIITERVREATTHITPKTGHKVVHVEYRDLIRDPIGTVRGIYEAAGLSFTPEYEDALRAYLEASARERESGKGSHHMPYSLEEFGLSDEYIENMFAQYMKEHGYR